MLSTNSKLQMKKHRAVNAVLLVASRLRRFQFISSRFLAIANTAAFSHSILSSRSLNRSNRDATLTVRAMSMPPLGVKRLYSIHRPGDRTSGIRACIQPTSISHFSLIRPVPRPALQQSTGVSCHQSICDVGVRRSCAPGRSLLASSFAAWRHPLPSARSVRCSTPLDQQ